MLKKRKYKKNYLYRIYKKLFLSSTNVYDEWINYLINRLLKYDRSEPFNITAMYY